MAFSLPHTIDEIQALVTKLIDEDIIRQKSLIELAVQFDNASAAKTILEKHTRNAMTLHKRVTGGSSSRTTYYPPQPTSPITDGFHTEKEHQQLLLDEETLRETLEEQARAEKEWEERIKKEQAKDELFMLEWEERIKKETKFTFLLPMYRL
ncbi:hypothetical protein Tco_1417361 [Tanacetum coccineum]